MTFVISSLKACFTFLNIISLGSAAVYLGFGAFMLISKQEVLGFGLREISVALLATGCGVIVLTIIGLCAGTGRRSFAMRFYSGCLLLGSIYQLGFGVLIAIRRSKTQEYMNDSWGQMTDPLRGAFEVAHKCCGFKDASDRTNCDATQIASAVSCSLILNDKQEGLLKWLCIALFGFAVLSFVNYLLAYGLIREYAKARRQFKQRENERKQPIAAKSTQNGKKEEIKMKYTAQEPETLKTAPMFEVKKANHGFLPGFLKATPKPVVKAQEDRSTGSMLTYEEISAKYRK